jgi:hypothetical protein
MKQTYLWSRYEADPSVSVVSFISSSIYLRGGGLALYNLIQPTISLEMPVPSQGHCGFHSFPVVD